MNKYNYYTEDKHRGVKLVLIWTAFILGSWLAAIGVYKASLWACSAVVEAIEFEQTTRAGQVMERVAFNSAQKFIRQ